MQPLEWLISMRLRATHTRKDLPREAVHGLSARSLDRVCPQCDYVDDLRRKHSQHVRESHRTRPSSNSVHSLPQCSLTPSFPSLRRAPKQRFSKPSNLLAVVAHFAPPAAAVGCVFADSQIALETRTTQKKKLAKGSGGGGVTRCKLGDRTRGSVC